MMQQPRPGMSLTTPCADGEGHEAYLASYAYTVQKAVEAQQPQTQPRHRTLSDKLKPPVEPTLKSAVTNAHKALGCLVFWIAEAIIAIPFALALVKTGLIQTPLTGIGNIIVGLCAIGVAVLVVRRVTRGKRQELEREYASEKRAYDSAKERYDRMYYCYKNSSVFLRDRLTGGPDRSTWSHEDTILPLLYKETW